jgi:hypothetical protein
MNSSRRNLILMTLIAPLGGLVAGRANATDTRCYDPATLSLSQKSRRRTLGYVDKSTNVTKRCGACAFYKKTAEECGSCDLLSGGPVVASGVCNSYASLKG